jgi:hypothetical protein
MIVTLHVGWHARMGGQRIRQPSWPWFCAVSGVLGMRQLTNFLDLIRRRLLFVDGGGELVGVGFETFAQGDVVAGGVRVADEWPPVVNLPDDVPTGPSIAEVGAEIRGAKMCSAPVTRDQTQREGEVRMRFCSPSRCRSERTQRWVARAGLSAGCR